MNLTKLFNIQKQLDERIIKEHELEGQDLLPEKILALQVELGELANEWRGFKFWSNNQKSTKAYNKGCEECVGGVSKLSPLLGPYKKCEYCRVNPLLEEYVDCLHFILSIGLELGMEEVSEELELKPHWHDKMTTQFLDLISDISTLFYDHHNEDLIGYLYEMIVRKFIGLGEMLGFTWGQIEQAYLDKNKINHQRQESGY